MVMVVGDHHPSKSIQTYNSPVFSANNSSVLRVIFTRYIKLTISHAEITLHVLTTGPVPKMVSLLLYANDSHLHSKCLCLPNELGDLD